MAKITNKLQQKTKKGNIDIKLTRAMSDRSFWQLKHLDYQQQKPYIKPKGGIDN
ncbi:hypothetical protein A0J48_025310 [Sphaerospermopsis aphanizomenoides BCCUSP55]|uniref:hypothetical protein n=1 Tax=Sphaerospermopsis aphanizomenoides TaxID=459663 RepID=UPI0019049DDF|nr:hypothetical protein [Sphaerospermopsis aphanizomenoides]MBK1990788.1 hypothetical protein [Sphaerospermopsis aphanizomenoides BCCUSP55]